VTLDLFVSGSLDRLCAGIGGMDGEATSGLELDVKGVFELPIFQRQLQTRELRSQGSGNVRLNLLL